MTIRSVFFSGQKNELSVGHERLPGLKLCFCDGSSYEARTHAQLSEDFLAYRYSYEESYFAFIVCDGVGQSSDAAPAARLFGKYMLQKLPDIYNKKLELENYAHQLKAKIRAEIAQSVDQNDPYYRFRALLREDVGSQVKFVCGMLDLKKGMLYLYPAGDVHFILYDRDGRIASHWRDDNGQFWSTKDDIHLNAELIEKPLSQISRISVSSDGIRNYFDDLLNGKYLLNDETLIRKVYEEGKDDLSILDMEFRAETLMPLEIPSIKLNQKRLEWRFVEHGERYRLCFSENDSVEETIDFDARQNQFFVPADLLQKDISIQALSSQHFSSKVSVPLKGAVALPIVPTPVSVDRPVLPADTTLHPRKLVDPHGTPTTYHPIDQTASGSRARLPGFKPQPLYLKVVLGVFGVIAGVVAMLLLGVYLLYGNGMAAPVENTPTATDSPAPTLIPSPTETPTLPLPTWTNTPARGLSPLFYLTVVMPTLDPELARAGKCQPPKFPPGWVTYRVQKGEVFYDLGKKFGIDYPSLMEKNCYKDARDLDAGDLIGVPSVPTP